MFSNSRKTIAAFIQLDFGENLTDLAIKMGYNVVYFNLQGRIGADYTDYGEKESKLIDAIPFDSFDAVIVEPDGINIETTKQKLLRKLKEEFKGPVVALRYDTDDWYSIQLDNTSGISQMVDHFIDEHGITDIAYLSGPEYHNDAIERLKSFREAMKRHSLPEDGFGVYYGDFWYNCGGRAIDHFFKGGRRPKGIICANDFMAISVCQELVQRGYRVPEDIIVSGFDGSIDGTLYFPPITTIAIQGERVIKAAMDIINDLMRGKERPKVKRLKSETLYRGSCGCVSLNLITELNERNTREFEAKYFGYRMFSASVLTLELNKAQSIQNVHDTIKKSGCFGTYNKFFFIAYMNRNGEMSYEKPVFGPTEKRRSAIAINHFNDDPPCETFDAKDFLPPSASGPEPQIYYVSDVHFDNHSFGYSAIRMEGLSGINDFYNLSTNNLSVAMESLLNKNNIAELIEGLEHMSFHDQMTGLYNWHGFLKFSDQMLKEAKSGDKSVCAMTFDLDGLKIINDSFGHSRGDEAISALAKIIREACFENELAARLGGDEFFVFASDYTQEKLDRFNAAIDEGILRFNCSDRGRPYTLGVSRGAYLAPASEWETVDDFRRISDDIMYQEKKSKPTSRK